MQKNDRSLTSRTDHVVLHPGEEANFPEISNYYRQTVLGECQVKNGLIVNGSNITIVSASCLGA